MSSIVSGPWLNLRPRTSRQLFISILIQHVLVLAACLSLPQSYGLPGAAGVLAAVLHGHRRWGRSSIEGLRWAADAGWSLRSAHTGWQPVELVSAARIGTWLVLLDLHDLSGGHSRLALAADAMPVDDHRRLRVLAELAAITRLEVHDSQRNTADC